MLAAWISHTAIRENLVQLTACCQNLRVTLTPMNGLISLIYQYCLYVYDVYVRLVIVIVRSPFLIKTSHKRLIWYWIIHAERGPFLADFDLRNGQNRSFEFEAIIPSPNHSIVSLETLIGY